MDGVVPKRENPTGGDCPDIADVQDVLRDLTVVRAEGSTEE